MDRTKINFDGREELLLDWLIEDIRHLNDLETKSLETKFMKFNEEFGEFSAETLKFLGHTYKEYNKDHLKEEMADTLQCLLSIFIDLGEKTNIDIVEDILPEVLKKNQKCKRNKKQ